MSIWSIHFTQERRSDTTNTWRPPVDVYRRGAEWLLKFDLAGVRPEDVRVRLAGSRITVSGVRRDWIVERGYHHHSMEISYNRFERTIELPGDLSGAQYSLEAKDGLLFVRVEPPERLRVEAPERG